MCCQVLSESDGLKWSKTSEMGECESTRLFTSSDAHPHRRFAVFCRLVSSGEKVEKHVRMLGNNLCKH